MTESLHIPEGLDGRTDELSCMRHEPVVRSHVQLQAADVTAVCQLSTQSGQYKHWSRGTAILSHAIGRADVLLRNDSISHVTWQLETEFLDVISRHSEGDYAERRQIVHGDRSDACFSTVVSKIFEFSL